MSEQLDKLREKAKLIGLDVDVLLQEIANVVIEKVPHLDEEKIALRVAGMIPKPEVDYEAIVARLQEAWPEGAGTEAIDLASLEASLLQKLSAQFKKAFEEVGTGINQRYSQIESNLNALIEASVERQLLAIKESLAQTVQARMLEVLKNGGGEAAAAAAGKKDKWDMILERGLPILENAMRPKDSVASLTESIRNIADLQAVLGQLGGPGIDPNLQYRSNQQIYAEGLKAGMRLLSGQKLPLSQNPLRRASSERATPSTAVDKLIKDL